MVRWFPFLRAATVLIVLAILCFLAASPSLATGALRPARPSVTYIDSDITTDTTWTLAGNPYHITDHIEVRSGATLTIEPGVQVYFAGKYYLHVYDGASIIARGTPARHISFNRLSSSVSKWTQIWFHPNTSSYFRYVDITSGGASASGDNTQIKYEGPGTHVVNNCTLINSQQMAIVALGSSLDVTVAGTHISDTGHYPLLADSGANLVVTGSDIQAGTRPAIYLRERTVAATISVSGTNLISTPPYQAILNGMRQATCISAQDNWWGAADGPLDLSSVGDACGGMTNAGSGSLVSNGVDYQNWLASSASLVGITTPPEAAFTISPDPSSPLPPGTVYTFDASDSTDDEDYTASMSFCWDWDNDTVCDTPWSVNQTAVYSFTTAGWNTVRMVVQDTDNLTGEVSHDVAVGYAPTPVFTYTLPNWAQVVFDGSASHDVEDSTAQLTAQWDWEGDGTWDSAVVSVTQVQTHTYPHLGRYWPTLLVQDTDSFTGTLRRSLDIVPLAASTPISGGGGELLSTDGSVRVAVYSDTADSEMISTGLVITHTPWLTVPHSGLPGDFTYLGFNLVARSMSDGQLIEEISGTYTITVMYDFGYITSVVGLMPFEDQLKLYRWSDSSASWLPTSFTLDLQTDSLVASTSFFGDFALTMDVKRAYLPLVVRSY